MLFFIVRKELVQTVRADRLESVNKKISTCSGVDSPAVKELMLSLGADLCGIACMDRFGDAPKGFHPQDVMPSCYLIRVQVSRWNAAVQQSGSVYESTQFDHTEDGCHRA